MKVVVRLPLSTFQEVAGVGHSHYAELENSLDLPFAPFQGLYLQFGAIEDDHDFYAGQGGDIEYTPVAAVYRIEKVTFETHTAQFWVQCYDAYETVGEMQAAVDELVAIYGFDIDDAGST